MEEIYIERIFHNKELVGIGSIWSTWKSAVDFLRKVKAEHEQCGTSIEEYDEAALSIGYRVGTELVTLSFEKRYVNF